MSYKNGSKLRGGKTYRQGQGLKGQIRKQANYTCALCGEYGDIVDHIIPYAVSHDSSLSNLRILCLKCNLATRRKRKDAALPLTDWYASLESQLR